MSAALAVWKFPLRDPNDLMSVDMPRGAEVLHVAIQDGTPCLWARVDQLAPLERRWFRFAGTGHPLGDHVGRHVGTIMLMAGQLVFHVFEIDR